MEYIAIMLGNLVIPKVQEKITGRKKKGIDGRKAMALDPLLPDEAAQNMGVSKTLTMRDMVSIMLISRYAKFEVRI